MTTFLALLFPHLFSLALCFFFRYFPSTVCLEQVSFLDVWYTIPTGLACCENDQSSEQRKRNLKYCDSRNYSSNIPRSITACQVKGLRKNFVPVCLCGVVVYFPDIRDPYICFRLDFQKMQYVLENDK